MYNQIPSHNLFRGDRPSECIKRQIIQIIKCPEGPLGIQRTGLFVCFCAYSSVKDLSSTITSRNPYIIGNTILILRICRI